MTCNYEARRRGIGKLQRISEARQTCPDVVVVLGEDLTRFRDASKELFLYLREVVWGDRVEKLGFDEVSFVLFFFFCCCCFLVVYGYIGVTNYEYGLTDGVAFCRRDGYG